MKRKATLIRIIGYLMQHKIQLFTVLVLSLTSNLLALAGPKLSGTAINLISDGGASGSMDFPLIYKYAALLLVFYVASSIMGYIVNVSMIHLSRKITYTLRKDTFNHLIKLPVSYFDNNTTGDILSRISYDIDTLNASLSNDVVQVLSSTVTIAGSLFMMLSLCPKLCLVFTVTIPLALVLASYLTKMVQPMFRARSKAAGELNGYVEEMINGQKVVKVFNHEEVCMQEFDKLNEELCENAYSAGKFSNMMGPINNNLGYVQYAILAIVGGAIAVNNDAIAAALGMEPGSVLLTLGSLMAFMQLSRNFNMPINQVSQQFNSIIMALAGAERIFEVMDQEPEQDEGYVHLVNAEIAEDGTVTETEKHTGHWAWKHFHKADGTTTYTELKGDIVMDMVDFSYVPEKQVLTDITLYARPGQKIAFVGATGAGKTTITNLINRFYDIADGKIRYDGININKIQKSDLRRSLGVVLQDVNLFTGTVMDNIRYGNLDASDEECIAAAKLANAHDFISRLPKGYDTELTGNGASLSQGQRQLISIARAAVADPPVMILDEATSSIDTRTEKLVQDGMDKLMHGRTVFVIAHRLSTVRNSDCIMVLDHGRIIEDLIAQKGTYYQLYTGAFELE